MMSTRSHQDARIANNNNNDNDNHHHHQFRQPSHDNDDDDYDDDALWAQLVGDRCRWIHPSIRTSLPVLDRAFVEQLLRLNDYHHHHHYNDPSTTSSTSTTTSTPLPVPRRLVRHIGMVQDMMEPEYYTHHPNDPNDDTDRHGSLSLSERQPLLVVPLPFGRHFQSFHRRRPRGRGTTEMENENHLLTIVIPESPPNATTTTTTTSSTTHHQRKRERDGTDASRMDEDDETMDRLVGPTARRRRSKFHHFKGNDEENNNNDDDDEDSGVIFGPESDWWPMGCIDSDPQEIAVLAKLYYDEYPEQEPLQLNDIVECVGMVSSSSSSWSSSSMEEEDMEYGCGSMVDEDVFRSFIPPRPPPASRLPRLHVLYFRKLSLEELTNDCNDEERSSQDDEEEDVSMGIAIQDPLHIWTDALGPTGDDVTVWQALFLTLVSQAERTQGRMVRIPPPAQHALGCVSLQLQMSPNTSESTAQSFYEQLLAFLRTTCPLVASVDLIQNTTSTTLIQGPGKETGRLFPNPWQLPRGSTIVIRYDGNYHNINDDDGDNNNGHGYNSNTLLLDELLRQHSISYSFEGGMQIPFDADYRIIVVTNAGFRLPCTLCCQMNDTIKNNTTNNNINDRFNYFDQRQLETLKQALSRARSVGNITLPRVVLEQAQHDFINRRERGRGEGQGHHQHLPNEEDFHRWLTLTRLFTRARGSAEATMADWQSALELDDSVRAQR